MCEASAYLAVEGREELLLEAVDRVETIGLDEWQLVSIFGEQKIIKARIKRMALVEHKLLFDPTD